MNRKTPEKALLHYASMQIIYTRLYIRAYPLRKTRGGHVHPVNRPTVHRLTGEVVETLKSGASCPRCL